MRSFIRLTAASWLACQLVAVCAAPVALAAMPVRTSSHDDEACCPGLKPGQVCPMHHTREGTKRCLMQNACAGADASLVALVFISGVVPQGASAHVALDSRESARVFPFSTIARFEPPDPPPPRLPSSQL